MNPLHKHKITSVGYQVKQNLKSGDMENLNSLLKFWVWESGRKIDATTGVTLKCIPDSDMRFFYSYGNSFP